MLALVVIHTFLSDYFANKAIQKANRVWDEQNWGNDKVQEVLNSHLCTLYIISIEKFMTILNKS